MAEDLIKMSDIKIEDAFKTVLELARQNVADQLEHPKHCYEQSLAIVVVEDWIINNLDEDN